MKKFMMAIRGFCPDGNAMLYGNPPRAYGIFNYDLAEESGDFAYMVDGKIVIRFRIVWGTLDYQVNDYRCHPSIFDADERERFLLRLSKDIAAAKKGIIE